MLRFPLQNVLSQTLASIFGWSFNGGSVVPQSKERTVVASTLCPMDDSLLSSSGLRRYHHNYLTGR